MTPPASFTRVIDSASSAGRKSFCGGKPHVVRVVGGAVNVVIALPVAEAYRHVGLAEDDAAGFLHPGDRQRVVRGPKILLRRKAPCRKGCWWCRKCRYSSASRRGLSARWSCRG